MPKQEKLKEYDDDPIIYCSKCYSIKVKHDDSIDLDYCGDCGCTDFKTAKVYDWEKLYVEKYGHRFVEDSHDIRKSPIFMMSISKLKTLVFKDESWKKLCKTLYPTFPEGISRADSIILLFAKLIQDNKLDDLRMQLINQNYK